MASLKSILDEEFRLLESKTSGKPKKNFKKVSEVLGSKKHGLKKQRMKIKRKRLELSAPKSKLYLNAVTTEDEQSSNARVEKNLERLMTLSKFSGAKLAAGAGDKILSHNIGTKRYYEPKEKAIMEKLEGKKKPQDEDEERAAFTEEDFESFSREYFCNSGPINRQNLEMKKKKSTFF